MCDDRGMTATNQITYFFVTCRDNPRGGTKIPGTLTSDQVRNHLANCPHEHDITLPDDLRDAIEAADQAFDTEMSLEDRLREARAATDAAMARVAELKRRYGLP
jgi:hypothetical protein